MFLTIKEMPKRTNIKNEMENFCAGHSTDLKGKINIFNFWKDVLLFFLKKRKKKTLFQQLK